ncbi:uncharacterized protein LOC123537028 [Mercenaria mercenaria]|uniref:uncharacterized protein LOC123537028 n=1 Tax=Mercenaria mercenaria TaxID=6596 RepID=UPI00234F8250|nr:uncharacterized protein LOC123537028 [Mercenaria mercenaria]
MKGFAILSVLYIYLETGLCIEETNISPVEANSDAISERSPALTLVKRNTALKRLPAWSVYYGKRSGEPSFALHNSGKIHKDESVDFGNIENDEIIDENDSDSGEVAFPRSWMNDYLEQTLSEKDEILNLDAEKRSNLKRLQPWMSTYGKRSDGFLDTDKGYDIDAIKTNADIGQNDLHDFKQLQELSENLYDMDDLQNPPTWPAKRMAGWSATYGKRVPWSVTYGKRAPWSVTYGKRDPWSVTYGKRAPWSVTYGKRSPWSVTYGKRAPWSVTYGKRAPWAVTYGKRLPWTATYGKRSQGWQAFYGKRAPMWQAVYGKRNADDMTSEVENTVPDNVDSSDDTSDIAEKRSSQVWSAFYGR